MCHVTPRLSALKHGTPRTHTSHTLTHAPRLSYCVQQEGRELSCTCPPSSASRQRLTKEGWKALDLVQLDRRLLGWGVLCGANDADACATTAAVDRPKGSRAVVVVVRPIWCLLPVPPTPSINQQPSLYYTQYKPKIWSQNAQVQDRDNRGNVLYLVCPCS